MKKLLYILNVADGVNSFSLSSILAAQRVGLEFHMAGDFSQVTREKLEEDENKYGIHIHQINLSRSPFSLQNVKAYRQIIDLIKKEGIEYIHCNTPIGGLLGRFAGAKERVKTIIYQAHGFHFYKGAPIINWLLYCPVEMILARMTDAIITINGEDYEFAMKHMHPRTCIYYVPGVGIELEQWKSTGNTGIRSELGICDDDFIVLVVGRLEKNKNCKTIIEAVSKLDNKSIKTVFCGDGEDKHQLRRMTKNLGISDRVLFIGNRTDMVDIYHMADCFVLASLREGLSRSIMEAMAVGLPCIVSNIRGNSDLIDKNGGELFLPNDSSELAKRIVRIFESENLRIKMGVYNKEKIKGFSVDIVVDTLSLVYKEQLDIYN